MSKYQSVSSLDSKWTPREFPLSDKDYASMSEQQDSQQTVQRCDDVFVAGSEEIINK